MTIRPAVLTTRAVACAPGGTRNVELALDPPGPGEALLRLVCCGLCGTDLFKLAHASAPEGSVLGHELVGVVEAVGEGVAEVACGDRVVVTHHAACGGCPLCRRGADTQCATFKENLLWPGGFSERLLVRPRAVRNAWRVPGHLSDAAASFLEPAACVLRGVDKAALPPHEGVALVIGGGAMGLLHLLVLRAAHPDLRVVVSEPEPERRRLARALGAVLAVPPERVEEAARETSDGLGADAAFDTVGGSGPLADALGALRPGGTSVLFAHAAEGEPAGFALNPFFKGERRLVATYSGGRSEQLRIARLLADGSLDPAPLISHRLPLARFADAVALVRARRALKVLLEPDP